MGRNDRGKGNEEETEGYKNGEGRREKEAEVLLEHQRGEGGRTLSLHFCWVTYVEGDG